MFAFKAIHASDWRQMLPRLNAAGKEGYHVVGFLSEGGCYTALMERGQGEPEITVAIPATHLQMNDRGFVEDRRMPGLKAALGPREQFYVPSQVVGSAKGQGPDGT
jgi:hypothetical protein